MPEPREPFIKVCGIRDEAVLEAAVRAGATALGFNFVAGVRRSVEVAAARRLIEGARRRHGALPRLIGIFADADAVWIAAVRRELGLDAVQLHGHETAAQVAELAPAYKAVRLGAAEDLEELAHFPGDFVLVDARVPGFIGGTGRQVPLELAAAAARRRPVVLAGGLNAGNVAAAIAAVRPVGVDSASGAESPDGAPSAAAAEAFVRAAWAGFEALRAQESR